VPLTVAHRGASEAAPENTLAAVRAAVARDSDLVEVDVQRSRDGALVLVHDTTLTRTTDVRRVFPGRAPWRVSDLTYDEMLRLDAGSWHSARFAGERIPTLQDAIEVVRRTRAGLLVELKLPALHPGIVADVSAALRRSAAPLHRGGGEKRLVVQSFDHSAVRAFKALAPDVPVGLLGAPPEATLRALGTWAEQVNPSYRVTDAAYVAAVHDAGMACLVWTVDRASSMRRALRMGVDGVITNRPDRLTEVLAGQGSRRTSLRML